MSRNSMATLCKRLVFLRHVTCVTDSRHTARINESCHTYECIMSLQVDVLTSSPLCLRVVDLLCAAT